MTRAIVQLAAAAVVALVGAWLVGLWLFGVVLIVIAVCVAADAVLRDDGKDAAVDGKQFSDAMLERYRRAR